MTQQVLPLTMVTPATFANYWSAANAPLVNYLQQWATGHGEPLLYISGETSSGKTHLLSAVCDCAKEKQVVYVPAKQALTQSAELLEDLEQQDIICIDDIDAWCQHRLWEEALFNLFNRIRDNGKRLLVSSTKPVKQLHFSLPDLSSRLASMLSLTLLPLADHDKIQVLKLLAKQRGLSLADEVSEFMLKRCPRDMSQLVQALDKLDKVVWQEKRRITIPLAKQVLGV